MTDEKIVYLRYRISLAHEAVASAELLMNNEFYRPAVNRLYYACFYAVSALLLQLGKSAKTHSGIRILFNKSVMHEGLLPMEYGDLYTNLFRVRHEVDYSDLVEVDPIITRKWLPSVKSFIEDIEQLTEERMGE